VGQLIPFPARRRASYEAVALDRLLAEVDRRREPRAVGGDDVARRPLRVINTVVPFRLADR
jgi:hypothetical protein